MPVIEENVSDLLSLSAEAQAARLWFARDQSTDFELTGIVDPQDVLEQPADRCARPA